MYVCMYVCMYVWREGLHRYVFMYVCMYKSVRVQHINAFIDVDADFCRTVYVCMYVCKYVCMYV